MEGKGEREAFYCNFLICGAHLLPIIKVECTQSREWRYTSGSHRLNKGHHSGTSLWTDQLGNRQKRGPLNDPLIKAVSCQLPRAITSYTTSHMHIRTALIHPHTHTLQHTHTHTNPLSGINNSAKEKHMLRPTALINREPNVIVSSHSLTFIY